MKKICRINLRLSDIQFREVEGRAAYAGLSAAEYIRSLIREDISTNTDAVIRRLARMTIFSAVAIRYLYTTIGHENELNVVNEEANRLLADMGIDDADD